MNKDIVEKVMKTDFNKFVKKIEKQIPSGRVAYPDDIAKLASFLASEKSFYINGEVIGINGGSNLG